MTSTKQQLDASPTTGETLPAAPAPRSDSAPTLLTPTNVFVPERWGADNDPVLPASVEWLPPGETKKKTKLALAGPALLAMDLFCAQQFRTGHRYPQQRNHHGYYWHTSARMQLWHESLLEQQILKWLDFSEDIVAIATQPFNIVFADGSAHVPDFIALHADNRQVLYDVKPRERITAKAQAQFEKTQTVCDAIGWGYEVHTELSEPLAANLAWVAMFRHPRFHPGTAALEALLDTLSGPESVDEVAARLPGYTFGNARAAIYHLVWERELHIDMNLTLTNSSLIRKA